MDNKLITELTETRKHRRRRAKKPYTSATVTTGDIGYNLAMFNRHMGTSFEDSVTEPGGESNTDSGTGICEDVQLDEAKRYVRRYYIRPQNIFASNKAEILKALVDIGDQDCSIYTLLNLGDEKDVTKLTNRDIIYYYDDGILYDKNHVRVMDWDLSIKKEEKRKHMDVDKVSDSAFADNYEDRMTAATELEEQYADGLEWVQALEGCGYDIISADFSENSDHFVISLNNNVEDIAAAAEELAVCLSEIGIFTLDWVSNGDNVIVYSLDNSIEDPFNIDFDSVNAYGESLTEAKEQFCCICGEPIVGYGNNPEPYRHEGRCCDGCNMHFVIPARLEQVYSEEG